MTSKIISSTEHFPKASIDAWLNYDCDTCRFRFLKVPQRVCDLMSKWMVGWHFDLTFERCRQIAPIDTKVSCDEFCSKWRERANRSFGSVLELLLAVDEFFLEASAIRTLKRVPHAVVIRLLRNLDSALGVLTFRLQSKVFDKDFCVQHGMQFRKCGCCRVTGFQFPSLTQEDMKCVTYLLDHLRFHMYVKKVVRSQHHTDKRTHDFFRMINRAHASGFLLDAPVGDSFDDVNTVYIWCAFDTKYKMIGETNRGSCQRSFEHRRDCLGPKDGRKWIPGYNVMRAVGVHHWFSFPLVKTNLRTKQEMRFLEQSLVQTFQPSLNTSFVQKVIRGRSDVSTAVLRGGRQKRNQPVRRRRWGDAVRFAGGEHGKMRDVGCILYNKTVWRRDQSVGEWKGRVACETTVGEVVRDIDLAEKSMAERPPRFIFDLKHTLMAITTRDFARVCRGVMKHHPTTGAKRLVNWMYENTPKRIYKPKVLTMRFKIPFVVEFDLRRLLMTKCREAAKHLDRRDIFLLDFVWVRNPRVSECLVNEKLWCSMYSQGACKCECEFLKSLGPTVMMDNEDNGHRVGRSETL